MAQDAEVRIFTPFTVTELITALREWLDADKEVDGKIVNNRISVAILNGRVFYLPGRGSISARFVSTTEGSVIYGEFGLSFAPKFLIAIFLALGVASVVFPNATFGSGMEGLALSILCAGFFCWVVRSDRKQLVSKLVLAVRGQEL